MKKIFCLLLALLLALAVPCGAVAVQTGRNYEIIDSWEDGGLITTEIKVGSSNGYDIHVYANSLSTWPSAFQRIGKYCFIVNYVQIDIYAVKGETKLSLVEAYKQSLIDLEEVVRLVDGFNYDQTSYDVHPVGDVNQDKALDVKDVILLQRNLAKEISFEFEDTYIDYPFLVLDCNLDRERNVQDVLIMQRLIAKMPVPLP